MTWHSGETSTKTDTPIWIKAVGGLGLGFGKSPLSPTSGLFHTFTNEQQASGLSATTSCAVSATVSPSTRLLEGIQQN